MIYNIDFQFSTVIYHQYFFLRSETAAAGPDLKGKIKTFCRERCHGYVIPEEGGAPLFLHISEYVFDLILVASYIYI